jgi:hypothetical protein
VARAVYLLTPVRGFQFRPKFSEIPEISGFSVATDRKSVPVKKIRVNSSAAHRIAPKAQNQLPVSPAYKKPLETLNSQPKIASF